MRLSLSQLRNLPTPPATPTWTPVPHTAARDALVRALREAPVSPDLSGERILSAGRTNTEIAMGFIPLTVGPENGVRLEAAWWNDHIKQRGLTYAVGEHVLICANGCLIAEYTMRTRRTSRVLDRVQSHATGFAGLLQEAYTANAARRERFARRLVGPDYARSLITRLAEAGVIPSSKILPVLREFESPSFDYPFPVASVLGIQSAVTHVLKTASPRAHYARTLLLTRELDSLVSL